LVSVQLSCDARDAQAPSQKPAAATAHGNAQASSRPTTGAPDNWKPWAISANTDLVALERDVAAIAAIDNKLRAIEPRPAGSVQSPRVQRYLRMKFDLLVKSEKLKRRCRENVLTLWVLTGYGADITQIAPGAIGDKAHTICRSYRQWLGAHGEQDLEAVLRDQLPANIDAIRTRYSLAALRVMKHWVHFSADPHVISHALDEYSPLKAASRDSAFSAMKEWYDSERNNLVWNADLQQFCRSGEEEFPYPDFELIPSLVDED
jgi:hypothetical protein